MRLSVRHFTAEDIPLRNALLRDRDVRANLTDVAALAGDDALTAGQLRAIAEEQATRRIFTVRRGEEVVGFWWMTAIDWRAQACELSVAVLPRFRHGLGLLLVEAAQEYLHEELNMQVIVDRVLEHNVMMHSANRLSALHRVRAEYNQFMSGRWCTSLAWTRTAEEFRTQDREIAARRKARAERIRAQLAAQESGER